MSQDRDFCEQLHVREQSFENLNLPKFALKVDVYTNIHKSKLQFVVTWIQIMIQNPLLPSPVDI